MYKKLVLYIIIIQVSCTIVNNYSKEIEAECGFIKEY